MKPKTTDLQIRGIPVKTRDALRRKAESKGLSMSQYLVDLIRRDGRRMASESLKCTNSGTPVAVNASF